MRKSKLCLIPVMTSICAIFMAECERTILPVDSSEKIEYLQGNTSARVVIKVLNGHTRVPLSGVTVAIGTDDPSISDSTGTVIFDSVKVGTYLITCARQDFESTYGYFSLTVDSNSNNVPVVNQSADIVCLARSGASVKGNVFYRIGDDIIPANNAKLECLSTNEAMIFQRPLAVTTSDDGSYTFDDLPEFSTYTITIQPFMNGSLIFKQTGTAVLNGRAAGDTVRSADIILEKFTDGNFIVMSHNLKTVTRTDSLKLKFSEPVDRDLLGIDSIYVEQVSTGARVLIRQIWQDDDKKLVIVPFDGRWNANQDYTLTIRKIRSVKGKPFDNTDFMPYTFSPITTGSLGIVQNVKFYNDELDTDKVDYNTSSVKLLWSELEHATKYHIYQKSSFDSTWLFLTSVTDTFVTIATAGKFNRGRKIECIVLGKNSITMSAMETATLLTVKDQLQPYIYDSFTRNGFNHSSSTHRDTIELTILSSYLPEPMDTTHKPVIRVKEASYVNGSTMYGDTAYAVDPDKCFWTWLSEQSGTLNIVIEAQKNGSYDSLKVDFTSVNDLAGNKADTSSGAGYLSILTRP